MSFYWARLMGYLVAPQVHEALGHVEEVQVQTGTSAGYTVYTCGVCGAQFDTPSGVVDHCFGYLGAELLTSSFMAGVALPHPIKLSIIIDIRDAAKLFFIDFIISAPFVTKLFRSSADGAGIGSSSNGFIPCGLVDFPLILINRFTRMIICDGVCHSM